MADTTRKLTDTLAQEAQNKVQEVTEEVLEKGRKTWKDLRVRGEETIAEARERGGEAWEDAQKLIRKYPARAIGAAFFIGAVLGSMLFNREDS